MVRWNAIIGWVLGIAVALIGAGSAVVDLRPVADDVVVFLKYAAN